MTNTTRRRLLVGIGGAATVTVAGCSGTPGGGEVQTGSSTTSSIITGTNIEKDSEIPNRYNLAVNLTENHGIDKLTLQKPDGSVLSEQEINSAQTQANLRAFDVGTGNGLSTDTHEIIAYSGDTVVTREKWTPKTRTSIVGANPTGFNQIATELEIQIQNTGEIPVTAQNAYVTGGYPLKEGEDRIGTSASETTIAPGEQGGIGISVEEYGRSLLSPPSESCDGSTQIMTVAVDMKEVGEITSKITVNLGGRYRDTATGSGCTEIEVENVTSL
jgi:hypothetical protein